MNIKKYIREQAEKDAEKLITEADRQFCWEFAQKAVEQHKNEKPRRWRRKRNKQKEQ